jgi:hypothetical protein
MSYIQMCYLHTNMYIIWQHPMARYLVWCGRAWSIRIWSTISTRNFNWVPRFHNHPVLYRALWVGRFKVSDQASYMDIQVCLVDDFYLCTFYILGGVNSGHFILQLAYLTRYNKKTCDQGNQGSNPSWTELSLKPLNNSWFGREFWPTFDLIWRIPNFSEMKGGRLTYNKRWSNMGQNNTTKPCIFETL